MRRAHLLFAPIAAVAVGGAAMLSAGPISVVAAGHHTPSASVHSAHYRAQARRALVRYVSHHAAPIQLAPGPRTEVAGTIANSSYNWGGYADTSTTNGAFSQISGKWPVPKATCSKEDQLAADWVGIDGFNSSTVEQDGTLEWCFQGAATYYTWYEMYPSGSVNVGTSVQPGDLITASVSRTGTAYTLAVTDATNPANSFTQNATCAAATCHDTSAEWIHERPSLSIGIVPLAKTATWKLTAATETANGTPGTIGSFTPNDVITMIDGTGTYDLATMTALKTGNAFTATFKNSY